MREDPVKPFKHDWRQLKYEDKEYDDWKDRLLAKTDNDWRRAAYAKVEKISARFRTSTTPDNKPHDVLCNCPRCNPNNRTFIGVIL